MILCNHLQNYFDVMWHHCYDSGTSFYISNHYPFFLFLVNAPVLEL